MKEQWRTTHHVDYEVSDLGRVRSWIPWNGHKVPRLLTIHPNVGGYARVRIGGKTHTVHTLVARAFIGPCPKGQECRHKDDDRMNARLTNLEYGSHKANIHDCILRQRRVYAKGERNGAAKLTQSQVRAMRALRLLTNTPLRALAQRFNVCISTAARIVKREQWAHV